MHTMLLYSSFRNIESKNVTRRYDWFIKIGQIYNVRVLITITVSGSVAWYVYDNVSWIRNNKSSQHLTSGELTTISHMMPACEATMLRLRMGPRNQLTARRVVQKNHGPSFAFYDFDFMASLFERFVLLFRLLIIRIMFLFKYPSLWGMFFSAIGRALVHLVCVCKSRKCASDFAFYLENNIYNIHTF